VRTPSRRTVVTTLAAVGLVLFGVAIGFIGPKLINGGPSISATPPSFSLTAPKSTHLTPQDALTQEVNSSFSRVDTNLNSQHYALVDWNRSYSSDAHRYIITMTWAPAHEGAEVVTQDGQIAQFVDQLQMDWCTTPASLTLSQAIQAGNDAVHIAAYHHSYAPSTSNGVTTHGDITVHVNGAPVTAVCYHDSNA
jgi:hypothetical protein